MSDRKPKYKPLSDRKLQVERPITSSWPIGDGFDERFREGERRRHLLRTLLHLAEFASNEGYPLASLMLRNISDDIGLVLFKDYQKKFD